MVKPFAFAELLARIDTIARRPNLRAEVTALRQGDLHLDLLTREAHRAGVLIDLQPREFLLSSTSWNARSGPDPDHSAGSGLGPAFRPQDQRCGNPCQPVARQDRQAVRQGLPHHPARGGLCVSAVTAPRRLSWSMRFALMISGVFCRGRRSGRGHRLCALVGRIDGPIAPRRGKHGRQSGLHAAERRSSGSA